ncbi:hypothetical protein FRC06_009569, partial [Ceratobasidium sp. 370]
MSLTTTMGVRIGPIVLATLLKHYLERHNVIRVRDSKARNELLFDEAFIVVKSLLEESSKHTGSRNRSSSPAHVSRLLLGSAAGTSVAPSAWGPETVGGSKWWQTRNGSPSNQTGARPNGDGNSAKTNDPALRRQSATPDNRHSSLFDPHPTRHHSVIGNSRREQVGGGGAELRRARTGRTRFRPVSAHGVVGEGTSAVKRPSTATGGGGSGSSVQVTANTTEPATPHPQLSTSQPRPSASQPHLSTPQPQPGESEPSNSMSEEPEEAGEAHYESEMDNMWCILYLHGGGYYSGSVDQQRYCVQRYARKMGGRVV